MELVRGDGAPLLVGHSAAGILAADLASRTSCRGIVIVDGALPPASGPVPPAEGSFLEWIRSLADEAGRLPPWPRWWRSEPFASWTGVALLARDPERLFAFEAGCASLSVEWFEDAIDLSRRRPWPAAYIQTSPLFAGSASEAQRLGWVTQRLEGTHLHPLLEPEETASAIRSAWRHLVGPVS